MKESQVKRPVITSELHPCLGLRDALRICIHPEAVKSIRPFPEGLVENAIDATAFRDLAIVKSFFPAIVDCAGAVFPCRTRQKEASASMTTLLVRSRKNIEASLCYFDLLYTPHGVANPSDEAERIAAELLKSTDLIAESRKSLERFIGQLTCRCAGCQAVYTLGGDSFVVTSLGVLDDFSSSVVLGDGSSFV